MPPSNFTYDPPAEGRSPTLREDGIESAFIGKLQALKYEYRPDITNRATLEANFRQKFEALNRVHLTDADCQARQRPPTTRSQYAEPPRSEGQFARLLDEIVTPDVFTAARTLRGINSFTRDDGTPLNYTLVNIKDWCKNTFEVVNQLRINTDNSHHRYDVLLLINGVPCVQIELKTLGINPRRAREQMVEYKADPGNGYTKTLLCFMQLFVVSNRDRTYYFANNNARHFAFDACVPFKLQATRDVPAKLSAEDKLNALRQQNERADAALWHMQQVSGQRDEYLQGTVSPARLRRVPAPSLLTT